MTPKLAIIYYNDVFGLEQSEVYAGHKLTNEEAVAYLNRAHGRDPEQEDDRYTTADIIDVHTFNSISDAAGNDYTAGIIGKVEK